MKNKGVFTVLTLKDEVNGFKNVIVYTENGVERYLEKYTFEHYNDAVNFLENNKEELDNYVTELKNVDKQKRDEAERNRKEREEKEKKAKKVAEKKKKERKIKNRQRGAGFLAGLMALPIAYLLYKGVSEVVEDMQENNKTVVEQLDDDVKKYQIKDENVLDAKFREFLVAKKIISCEVLNNGNLIIIPLKTELSAEEIANLVNEFFTDDLFKELLGDLNKEITELTDDEKIDFVVNYLKTIGISFNSVNVIQDIENIITTSGDLSTENFEELVSEFAKLYVDNNLSVSTEDLVKFSGIMLIDRLAEENPELVQELFGVQSPEEFLNDAGKVIGVTYMYNHQIFEKEKSTDNFIWISAGIPEGDTQKKAMELIEDYVKRIAAAVLEEDAEKVQAITDELINELTSPTGRLNALDDGTEFASQVYFALINNSLARNYLTQEQRDYFNVRATSETNISNILTVISGCIEKTKSRTLTK